LRLQGRLQGLGKRPLVMGILNVTPDSFSDGGRYMERERALEYAREMVAQGADIIDVGGESTRPGAHPISLEEEVDRVVPVVEALSRELEVPISVDTCKAPVAKRALETGAIMVNDISGLRFSPHMVDVVAQYKPWVVVMHMKGTPRDMQEGPWYENVMGEVEGFFENRLRYLESHGISKERIILDPGIGFGKRLEDNLSLLRNIDRFLHLGCPIMVGPSRKSFIGTVLDLPVEERLEGTLAAVSIAVFQGAQVVRVHDVQPVRRAVDLAWAMRGTA
jgi:dihydropteroate synthase